ncbi:MAG TPA: malonic semialdehyde reductase [Rubricoccaceae bacterium]|jgi:3-hydroxypropanoate dehydrogenase
MTETAFVLADDAQDLLFREARTANAFTDKPVDNEVVRAVYDLVRWGPTAVNGQPLRVLLVRSDEARARLLPLMSEGNQAKTAGAPLVAVLAYDTRFHEHLGRVFPHAPGARSWFEGSPDADREGSAHENAAL